jgi:hypothetical protein
MINEPMVSDPIEILLVEDNEDDIVLIEEAFIEAKLMNVIFKVRDGEGALAYLRQEGRAARVDAENERPGRGYRPVLYPWRKFIYSEAGSIRAIRTSGKEF